MISADAQNVVNEMLAKAYAYPYWHIQAAEETSFKCSPKCITQIIHILKETYHCGYSLSPIDSDCIKITVLPFTFRFE